MGILNCIIFILELINQLNNIPIGKSFLANILVILYLIFITFTDCVEKYIVEKNFINPFIIMSEGIFGFIFSKFYSTNKEKNKKSI